ncbi:MAG: hypothetical protein HY306_06355 [Nitrosomonadales bacterium]|nr:hypothetical protein [Nitrosomonadales bacterium]
MNQLYIFIIASLITTLSFAEPLVIITCHEPMGSSMEYGVSSFERVQAAIDKKQKPTKSHFKEAIKNGYERKPTFIIGSDKKKATIVWAESAEEAKQRELAKSVNVPYCCSPSPATDANIVMFTPDQISALQVDTGIVTLYSFFPKLGTVFIASQYTEPSGKNSTQLSTFAECEFAWNSSQ